MALSIRTKLLGIVLAGIIGVGAISAVCFSLLIKSVSEFEDLLNGEVSAAFLASDATLGFKIQVQEWKNVLLRGHDDAQREKYWDKFTARHESVQTTAKQLLAMPLPTEQKEQVKSFVKVHSELLPKYQAGLDAFVNAGYNHKAGDAAVKGIDREPTKLIDSVTNALLDMSKQQSASVQKSASSTVTIGLVIMVLSVIVLVVLAYLLINRSILTPMTNVRHYLKNLRQGQLEFKVAPDTGDEMGQMYESVRDLQHNMNESCNAIKASLDKLTSTAKELHDIATTSERDIQHAHRQTDQMATAITEMSAASAEVAKHAANAADVANEVEGHAKQGVKTMHQAISTINATSEQIANTAEVVRKLEEDTKSVGTVLDVIKGIAEQTNLLALNAAIEAARAGEQGRGFAVVADEVRTLAQRTQESTAEIHTIIENVQNGAQNAVSAIETGQTRTDSSVAQVNEAGEKIDNISNSVQHILGTNEQIAQAAQEQSSVADDISRTVNEITAITESSAKHAQRTAGFSDELRSMADTLNGLMRKLKA